MGENYCYVFYDIPDDRLRYKVANKLKDYGLERLQKSVFFGKLSWNRAEELKMVLDDLIGDEEADVRIAFIPPSYVNRVIVVRAMYRVDFDEEVIVV